MLMSVLDRNIITNITNMISNTVFLFSSYKLIKSNAVDLA